jgi:hypothetical protein
MSCGGHEGQIIGLKKKAPEAAAREHDFERRIKTVIETLERHREDNAEQLPELIHWVRVNNWRRR